jgi:hypothetical protein
MRVVQKRNKYNEYVIQKLVEQFGVTAYYIRQSINGNRVSASSTTIKNEYLKLDSGFKTMVEGYMENSYIQAFLIA